MKKKWKGVLWIVPDNALFWLRDLTRGREEHIFFMQNRRQKFPTF